MHRPQSRHSASAAVPSSNTPPLRHQDRHNRHMQAHVHTHSMLAQCTVCTDALPCHSVQCSTQTTSCCQYVTYLLEARSCTLSDFKLHHDNDPSAFAMLFCQPCDILLDCCCHLTRHAAQQQLLPRTSHHQPPAKPAFLEKHVIHT